MKIELCKAAAENACEIHRMQLLAFRKLLEKYQDYETNPGNEDLQKILHEINQETTDFYIIKLEAQSVGAIRISKTDDGDRCRINRIFILPEYQNKGIAQKVFEIAEKMYSPKKGWILNTILQETGNCYLYEKMGYKKTGKTEKIKENMDIVYYEKLT
ncbi:GNAT family N-acetyltransferase [Breznakiella homolactica]|uniref:GNAT family N-acetyltransferase n=1 Tax=Breznakiella homolactica TaxID=2798577 RepID=A0A7T8BBD4_9SPIR|nr:GNAT family N-acetyltransferase [Breznakiella homolactica]QQO09920.1 GNAT family N-acetyltransferase [Breznakiella homolactica]